MMKTDIKKLICILLYIITMLIPLSLTAKGTDVGEPYGLGDLDGDGEVTAADARITLLASSRITTITEQQKKAADVMGDGAVTAAASRVILRYSSRLINIFPIQKTSAAVWTEVPIEEGGFAFTCRSDFDLRWMIAGQQEYTNICFFSGTVVSLKEFEVSWTDDKGGEWGSFTHSIIEVKLNKEYYGKVSLDGDVIKVMFVGPISYNYDHSIHINEGGEYIFTGLIMDERYTAYKEKYVPEDKSESEKYADVVMGGLWNTVFAIDDGKVILYHGYFDHDNEARQKILPYDSVITDKLTSGIYSLETGDFIAMNMDDFEEAFLRLFENPENLPTIKRD